MLGSAQAATQTNLNNTSKFDVRVPIRNWLKKMNDGFRVSLGQGTLNTNTRARAGSASSNAGAEASTNEDATTKFQLDLGWEEIKVKEVAYSAFATYQNFAMDGTDMRNMRLSGNATYGFDPQLYVYGGVNWGKYYGSGTVESNISSGIGFQGGVGFKIVEQARLEMEYVYLQNEGRINDINLDIETKGILLKLKTPLTFDI